MLEDFFAEAYEVIIKVEAWSALDSAATILSLRCPGCGQIGSLTHFSGVHDLRIHPNFITGQRQCPNPKCRAHVFIASVEGTIIASYPAQRIDFDTTDIPANVLESMDEALTCHAHQCYVAAAIMVRKTLEDICRDRGANGSTLKERLTALGSRVVLPRELLAALDDLRLLGNDAAHVESQTFDDVGEAEIETSIAVAKEVLKGVYQYSSLLKQLQALKKPATP